MTMFAVRSTSTREDRPHAEPTTDGKTTGHALARHGRRFEDARTRSCHPRTQFPRTTLSAGRSTVELAREPGAGAKTESGQAQRIGLRGGHRLPGGAWTGQVGGAGSGQRLHLGPQSPEHLRDRTLRCGQELSGLSPGTESLSRRLLGSLSSPRCLTAGPRLVPSRWQVSPSPGSTQSHRGSGHRRLGHGAVERKRAPRALGNLRGSLPNSFHRSHFPTAGLALARADRRSHHRRRHPRPLGPQRPSHRVARRVHAKKSQPTQGSKPGMIPIFYIEEQGQRGCCPFPLHPKSPPTPSLRFAPDKFCLTIPNTYSTITMPASLRSDCCSPSLRNAVRLPSGIDVHLHRNTHYGGKTIFLRHKVVVNQPDPCAVREVGIVRKFDPPSFYCFCMSLVEI